MRGDDLGERKRSRKERFKCAREKPRVGIGGKMLFLLLRGDERENKTDGLFAVLAAKQMTEYAKLGEKRRIG